MVRVKAVYGVSELARMAGLTRQSMHRLLKKNGTKILGRGERSKRLVTLRELRHSMPEIWDSIVVAKNLNS